MPIRSRNLKRSFSQPNNKSLSAIGELGSSVENETFVKNIFKKFNWKRTIMLFDKDYQEKETNSNCSSKASC